MNQLPPPLSPAGRTRVLSEGRRLVYFGGCDYFRMASNPATLKAAAQAARLHGLSIGASRMTTGNSPLLVELERELAAFFKVPQALVTPTGSTANACLAEGLAGEFTHVFLDERAHASLQDAVIRMDCRVIRFAHRDPRDLERRQARLVESHRILLITDGVFPLDGAIAPLAAYRTVLRRAAWMWVDDCHGAGTVGETGTGTTELEGIPAARLVRTLTLSKAFGTYGGVILASKAIVGRVVRESRTFATGTPPPAPCAAAALEALRLLRTDPTIRQRLAATVLRVKSALTAAGYRLEPSPAPIVSIVPKTPGKRQELERNLLAEGIHPSFIRYPGGPPQGLFRFALSSEHSPAQVTALIRALTTTGKEEGTDGTPSPTDE